MKAPMINGLIAVKIIQGCNTQLAMNLLKYLLNVLDVLLVNFLIFSFFSQKLIFFSCLGRGGAKIRDLQFYSGALINVTKEIDGEDTKVKIVGADEEIKAAKRLIEPFTEEPKPRKENIQVMKLEEPPPMSDGIDWEKSGEEYVSIHLFDIFSIHHFPFYPFILQII